MRAETIAAKVADRAAEAWYGHHVTDNDAIAVGVVAALALFGKSVETAPRKLEAEFLKLDDDHIAKMLAGTWAQFWLRRPDLGRHTYPLRAWLEDDPYRPEIVRSVAMTARAAVKAGLFTLTDAGHLHETDLVGAAYMSMKTTKARQARGEFYTPADMCDLMARMTLGSLKPGMKIGEPSAGTGGMIRAVAQVIRQEGMDPAEFWWIANDISPVSVAGLAVNLELWDIGLRTVIGTADTLTNPDWQEREWKANLGAFEWRDSMVSNALTMAAIRRVEGLIAGVEQEQAPEPVPARLLPSGLPAGPVVQLSMFDDDVEKAS